MRFVDSYFCSLLQILNEPSLFPLLRPKNPKQKSAEMANFCQLSDGNHEKPLSLAWCLPETINRTVQLKLSPGLLKPQPKVVRQSLNPGGCFGVCWPSMVATRKSKFCWVTCLVWGFAAEVSFSCIYHQMLRNLFLDNSWLASGYVETLDLMASASQYLLILWLFGEGILNIDLSRCFEIKRWDCVCTLLLWT